jgi:hypothetical protein
MRKWSFYLIAFLLMLASSATAVQAPAEYRKFIIDRPDLRKEFAQNICERIQICSSVKFDRSIAVIIGVSDYDYLPKLKSTADDARKIKDFLLESGEFDHIVFLTEHEATKERIEYFMDDYIPELLAESGDRVRFLFYFSGHGETRGRGSQERGYLRLADNKREAFHKAIGMDTVATWAKRNTNKAIHSLFIVDACLSGLIGDEIKGDPKFSPQRDPVELMQNRAGYLFTAGDRDQNALARADWGGSLFTAALIDGIKSGAADTEPSDGIITAHELFGYIEGVVNRESKGEQTPKRFQFMKFRSGDFFFISPKKIARAITGSNSSPAPEIKVPVARPQDRVPIPGTPLRALSGPPIRSCEIGKAIGSSSELFYIEVNIVEYGAAVESIIGPSPELNHGWELKQGIDAGTVRRFDGAGEVLIEIIGATPDLFPQEIPYTFGGDICAGMATAKLAANDVIQISAPVRSGRQSIIYVPRRAFSRSKMPNICVQPTFPIMQRVPFPSTKPNTWCGGLSQVAGRTALSKVFDQNNPGTWLVLVHRVR